MADTQDHSAMPVDSHSPDIEENMSIGRYIATRIPSLKPPMRPAPNPFKALTLLNRQQWLFFAVCISLDLPSAYKQTIYYLHSTPIPPPPRRIENTIPEKAKLNQHFFLGRFRWMVMGCLRFLHRLPHNLPASQNLRQIRHRYHLGNHPSSNAPIRRRHHIRNRL
jgi:hypothetical protein